MATGSLPASAEKSNAQIAEVVCSILTDVSRMLHPGYDLEISRSPNTPALESRGYYSHASAIQTTETSEPRLRLISRQNGVPSGFGLFSSIDHLHAHSCYESTVQGAAKEGLS